MIESRIEQEVGTLKVSAMTRAELAEAIHEDEQQLGRPHSPGEREAFCAGYLGLHQDSSS